MRLISVSLFCLVTIVAVLAVDPGPSECTSDSCSTKDRSLMEADALLKSKEADANDSERNFDGASELLKEFEANEHGADPNVIAILQAFLNLRSIGADLNNFRPQCTTEEFDKLIQMKRLMNDHITEAEWDRGGSRIRGLFRIMQRHFIEICSKRVKIEIDLRKNLGIYPRMMAFFRIFMKEESRDRISYLRAIHNKRYLDQFGVYKYWKMLLYSMGPTRELFIQDSSTRNYDLNEDYTTELFNNLFEETCDRITNDDRLRETFELNSKMLDEYFTDPLFGPIFKFEDSIGDYLICKAAKSFDYLRLLKIAISDLQAI